ncbi:MAG: coproporphyrinogen III oxidase [Crocinitomicaceae bacterium]|jgi:coproporphyrinogen III oxidase
MTKENFTEAMQDLQDRICKQLETLDGGAVFKEDLWKRDDGGGGRTRILQDGNLIEKGGVNFSQVYGDVTPMMRNNTEITGDSFFATGVSIVLHPSNPHVPIIHMNVRYFEMDNGVYWYGGGIDLTPHYIVPNQAKDFHLELKRICDKYNPDFYPRFKNWADDYFYIPHREETRGIGGVFFDHLTESDELSKDSLADFCITLGDAFPTIYKAQAELGRSKSFTESEAEWMNLRRGRYVEFNLVNDRGTKFGLVSGGRTESILMSLPKNAGWIYNIELDADSKEAQTQNQLKKGIDWIQH